jgi:hypothetical protein
MKRKITITLQYDLAIGKVNLKAIVLNWNGLQDTLDCLESALNLNYPNFEVVVVDNGSTDNSPTVIKNKYPQVSLINWELTDKGTAEDEIGKP